MHAIERGHYIPLISLESFSKAIKKSIFAYMIYVKDSMLNNVQNSPLMSNSSQEELSHMGFLDEFASIFTDSILGELPPPRGDNDHKIEIVLGSFPPNKPPYRVSYAQQEEIMVQMNDLLEKRMIQPSSLPFCLPILLVQRKDGSHRMCRLSCTK